MHETNRAVNNGTEALSGPTMPFTSTMHEADSRLARAEEEAGMVPLHTLTVKDLLTIVDARTKRRVSAGGSGLAEKLREAEVLENIATVSLCNK